MNYSEITLDNIEENFKKLSIKNFQIFIQLLYWKDGKYKCSKTLVINTYQFENILSIKKKIQDKIDISTTKQTLFFTGKILSEGDSLNDYNIERDNTIHLFLK